MLIWYVKTVKKYNFIHYTFASTDPQLIYNKTYVNQQVLVLKVQTRTMKQLHIIIMHRLIEK